MTVDSEDRRAGPFSFRGRSERDPIGIRDASRSSGAGAWLGAAGDARIRRAMRQRAAARPATGWSYAEPVYAGSGEFELKQSRRIFVSSSRVSWTTTYLPTSVIGCPPSGSIRKM
jgi:hypothetical protein